MKRRLIALVLALLAVFAVRWYLQPSAEEAADRDAITACKVESTHAPSLADMQSLGKRCEVLEIAYEEKWGHEP